MRSYIYSTIQFCNYCSDGGVLFRCTRQIPAEPVGLGGVCRHALTVGLPEPPKQEPKSSAPSVQAETQPHRTRQCPNIMCVATSGESGTGCAVYNEDVSTEAKRVPYKKDFACPSCAATERLSQKVRPRSSLRFFVL
jgi:hypothetical protein